MTGAITADPFALFSPEIISELGDVDRFIEVMADFYEAMAGHHDCYIKLNDRRLADAHAFWLEDAERSRQPSYQGPEGLDHFKQASLIAFWLRRMVPINEMWFCEDDARVPVPGGSKLDVGSVSESQAHFARYGSELCALFAGFYICLTYEVQEAGATVGPGKSNVYVLGAGPRFPRGRLPDQFLDDYPRLLKSKNISAHGLYMMYCALFADNHWRVRQRAAR